MFGSIRHSWRHPLAAFALAGAFGTAQATAGDAVAVEDLPSSAAAVQSDDKNEKDRKVKQADQENRDAAAAELKERIGQLEREIAELLAAGKQEEAEKLVRHAKEMQAKFERLREQETKKPDRADPESLRKKGYLSHKQEQASEPEGRRDTIAELQKMVERLQAENEKLRAALEDHKKTPLKADTVRVWDVRSGKPVVETKPEKKPTVNIVKVEAAAIHREIVELKLLAERLAAEGHQDKAEAAAREAHELAEKLLAQAAEFALKSAHGESAKGVDKRLQAISEFETEKSAKSQLDKASPNVLLEYRAADRSSLNQELVQIVKELRSEVTRLRDEVAELRRSVQDRQDKSKR